MFASPHNKLYQTLTNFSSALMTVLMEADQLNSLLQAQSYANGHSHSFTDNLFINAIDKHTDISNYLSLPHVKRWYNHIKSRKACPQISDKTKSKNPAEQIKTTVEKHQKSPVKVVSINPASVTASVLVPQGMFMCAFLGMNISLSNLCNYCSCLALLTLN